MLRFRTSQEQREQAECCPRPLDTSTVGEPRIEAYLDSVCAGRVPCETETLRAEVRGHLQDLVEAYEELGDSHEAAVDHAIAQFGEARNIRRSWRRLPSKSARHGFRTSLAVYAASLLWTWLATLSARIDFGSALGSTVLFAWFPFLPGLAAGVLCRKRPARSSFAAQSALLAPWLALSFWIFVWPKYVDVLRDRGLPATLLNGVGELLDPHSIIPLRATATFFAGTGVLWVLAGTASAVVGGWVARLLQEARTDRRRVESCGRPC